ncbi:MAG TPA: hypothetical protein VG963_12020, partial [Polyangiaceae bacterium]|nr:hypothetical protein [Polyangiaceae bacterium]
MRALSSCSDVLGDVKLNSSQPGAGSATVGGGSAGDGTMMAVGMIEPGPDCEPSDVRCDESWLESCVEVRQGVTSWLKIEDCGTADLCDKSPQAHCLASACHAGDSYCDGATPRVCNAALNGWDGLPACDSAATCSTNAATCPNGIAPCCLTSPCTAGEMRCNQGGLERCRADQSGWDSVESCESQDLCLGGLGACTGSNACHCQAPVCAPGETMCDGVQFERCNAGRTGWDILDQCATPELCQQGRALEPAHCQQAQCDAGAFFCTSAGVLQSCRPDRTGFQDIQQCDGGAAFCNTASGQCDPTACQPGERRCNGAQIEVCLNDRTGFGPDGEPCATPELCSQDDPNNVHCNPPACDVGAVSCFGTAQLSACNQGRTAFAPVGAPCLRPDLCSAERRRCDFCFPGRQECNPTLTTSRVCSTTGNFFGPETPCPLGCNAPTGTCIPCTVGQYQCQGGTLTRCNDGRSFTPINRASDCSGASQVSCINGQPTQVGCGAPGCNAASGVCNECSGNQTVCDGNGFKQCNGGVFGPTQACDDGLTCAGPGICSCTPLATSCVDGTLQECD